MSFDVSFMYPEDAMMWGEDEDVKSHNKSDESEEFDNEDIDEGEDSDG